MTKIWLDIKNSHEPAFFKPFLKRFNDHEFFITSRQSAEITDLLNKMEIKNNPVGKHYGKHIVEKILGLFIREATLFFRVPEFDVALSHGSTYAIHVGKLRLRNVICFSDNDMENFEHKVTLMFIDYLIIPNVIPINTLIKQGAKKESIIQYNGFKEDVYVADFRPDPNFLDDLLFDDFITIRPEALQAAYVSRNAKTIVPQLLSEFVKENVNILYLPRYPEDNAYAKGYDNVYIPP
jgi:predicted glycosyltransferase